MKTCLIITCYNRPAYLAQTLDSLKKLTTLPDSVLIIDDCSTDEETLKSIEDFTLNCKVEKVYLEKNLGIKNALLEACFGAFNVLCADIVLNLDSDAIVRPHLIPTILNLKLRFPHSIVSGFNCNNLDNPVIGTGDGYVIRKKCNGINMCFDKGQFNHYIKPALLKEGDWDNQVEAPFIISSPSVVQHIGEESAMGHPRFDQAEDYKILPKMKISIIHPSRGRAEQAYLTAEKWLSRAKNRDNIQYWLSLDSDDTSHEGYMHEFMNKLGGIMCCTYPNNSAIEAINYAATKCDGDLIIVVSDDFDCPHHWDELLVQSLRGKEDFVVKTDDGVQPWIITLPIMDRKYYERFGYIYNPLYRHMFCDTEMTHVADLLDRKITLPITFTHLHYTTGASAKDSINEKNDSTWDQGKAVYLEGVKNDFGLGDQVRGKLNCFQDHIDWLRGEGVQADIKPLLTILIPTVNGRERQFDRLVAKIHSQKNMNPDVELLFCKDAKEVSIGYKRQYLLQCATGLYTVFIDDDDDIADNYLDTILPILKEQRPDSIGYKELVKQGESERIAIHSNRFSGWGEGLGTYDYYRTPFYKVPIKTEIALQVGFDDVRYGEDKMFADRLKELKLIKNEAYIDEVLITYNAPINHNHAERYGIKQAD